MTCNLLIDIMINDGCLFSLIMQKMLIQSQGKFAVSCPFLNYSDCLRRLKCHCEKIISILITLVFTCGKSYFPWFLNPGSPWYLLCTLFQYINQTEGDVVWGGFLDQAKWSKCFLNAMQVCIF